MAKIYGQIESLSKIRQTLDQHGITGLNSVADLNRFLKQFKSNVTKIKNDEEDYFEMEVNQLQKELFNLKDSYEYVKNKTTTRLDLELQGFEKKKNEIRAKKARFLIFKWIYGIRIKIIEKDYGNLKNKYDYIVKAETKNLKLEVDKKQYFVDQYIVNKNHIIEDRVAPKEQELRRAKNIIKGLDSLILGAIGERKVENELKRLTDDYIIINNFSASFTPPIYNRHENDRIFSVQIDHLVICKSGVFILETKNWSKASINRLDLRSPIEQIKRTSYALFNLLNGKRSKFIHILERHHWGSRQIPIKNVLVMINHKPKDKFKHVAVKTLKELNNYIQYFEPILSDYDVRSITSYLLNKT